MSLYSGMDQAANNSALEAYFSSLGKTPGEAAEKWRHDTEEVNKQNELAQSAFDVSAGPWLEHGIQDGVTRLVGKGKDALKARAKSEIKKRLVQGGFDEDTANKLVEGELKPSEALNAARENLRSALPTQEIEDRVNSLRSLIGDRANQVHEAVGDAASRLQDAADAARDTAGDYADQAAGVADDARTGTAGFANQWREQAADAARSAANEVPTLSENPGAEALRPFREQTDRFGNTIRETFFNSEPNISDTAEELQRPGAFKAEGTFVRGTAPLGEPVEAGKGSQWMRGKELKARFKAIDPGLQDVVRDTSQSEFTKLRQMQQSGAPRDAILDQQQRVLNTAEDALNTVGAPYNVEGAPRQVLPVARTQRQFFNASEDTPSSMPSEDVAPRVAQQAEVDSQAQSNPSVDADSFGEHGGGVSKRVTQGDGSAAQANDVTDTAADQAANDASTAEKVASATDDAVDVAAAGEGFLDPIADLAALGTGIGLMVAGEKAKKSLPPPPAPLATPNAAAIFGLN